MTFRRDIPVTGEASSGENKAIVSRRNPHAPEAPTGSHSVERPNSVGHIPPQHSVGAEEGSGNSRDGSGQQIALDSGPPHTPPSSGYSSLPGSTTEVAAFVHCYCPTCFVNSPKSCPTNSTVMVAAVGNDCLPSSCNNCCSRGLILNCSCNGCTNGIKKCVVVPDYRIVNVPSTINEESESYQSSMKGSAGSMSSGINKAHSLSKE